MVFPLTVTFLLDTALALMRIPTNLELFVLDEEEPLAKYILFGVAKLPIILLLIVTIPLL